MSEFPQEADIVLRRRWQIVAAICFGVIAGGGGVFAMLRASHSAAAVVTPYPHDLAQVSFAVAGDVIPHEAVKQAAAAAGEGEQGWAQFSAMADVFQWRT